MGLGLLRHTLADIGGELPLEPSPGAGSVTVGSRAAATPRSGTPTAGTMTTGTATTGTRLAVRMPVRPA